MSEPSGSCPNLRGHVRTFGVKAVPSNRILGQAMSGASESPISSCPTSRGRRPRLAEVARLDVKGLHDVRAWRTSGWAEPRGTRASVNPSRPARGLSGRAACCPMPERRVASRSLLKRVEESSNMVSSALPPFSAPPGERLSDDGSRDDGPRHHATRTTEAARQAWRTSAPCRGHREVRDGSKTRARRHRGAGRPAPSPRSVRPLPATS